MRRRSKALSSAALSPPRCASGQPSFVGPTKGAFDEFARKVGEPFGVLFKPAISKETLAKLQADDRARAGGGGRVADGTASDTIARQLGVSERDLL